MNLAIESQTPFILSSFAVSNDDVDHRTMSISEMARQHDTTHRTLRFYESRGLLNPLRHGQNRKYDAEAQRRFRLILEGRRLGFTLSEIASMLAHAGGDSGSERLRISASQLREQIASLEERHRQIEKALSELRRRCYLLQSVSDDEDLAAPGAMSADQG